MGCEGLGAGGGNWRIYMGAGASRQQGQGSGMTRRRFDTVLCQCSVRLSPPGGASGSCCLGPGYVACPRFKRFILSFKASGLPSNAQMGCARFLAGLCGRPPDPALEVGNERPIALCHVAAATAPKPHWPRTRMAARCPPLPRARRAPRAKEAAAATAAAATAGAQHTQRPCHCRIMEQRARGCAAGGEGRDPRQPRPPLCRAQPKK